jgi:nucleoside-diphosphate-sugar epimerase
MNVLVTGGSGYIGSVLVPALQAEGHEVTVMDLVQPLAGTWVRRDVFAEPLQPIDLRKMDVVIHLAAIVGDETCNQKPGSAVEVNFLATKYLAKACCEAGTRLIFSSTCSVYGVKHGLSNEETDPEPYSVYGLTKLKAEEDVLKAGGVVFRLGTVYGISPRMSYILVINEFVRAAKTGRAITVFGGGQMRPFLEVHSAVRAFCAAVKSDIRGEIINIADVNISLRQLGDTVCDIFGGTVKYIPEMVDRRSYQVDNSKAIRLLDFKPVRIAEGLKPMKALTI